MSAPCGWEKGIRRGLSGYSNTFEFQKLKNHVIICYTYLAVNYTGPLTYRRKYQISTEPQASFPYPCSQPKTRSFQLLITPLLPIWAVLDGFGKEFGVAALRVSGVKLIFVSEAKTPDVYRKRESNTHRCRSVVVPSVPGATMLYDS